MYENLWGGGHGPPVHRCRRPWKAIATLGNNVLEKVLNAKVRNAKKCERMRKMCEMRKSAKVLIILSIRK